MVYSTHRGGGPIVRRSFVPRLSFNPAPRGVRRRSVSMTQALFQFQSRTRGGCDEPVRDTNTMVSVSTRPRGVRPPRAPAQTCYFVSSRPAGGCDTSIGGVSNTFCVSIHAHAGGRLTNFDIFRGRVKFQSTHPRGVRQNITSYLKNTKEFQSTHPRGVRHEAD